MSILTTTWAPAMARLNWVSRLGEGSKSGGAAGLQTQTVLGDKEGIKF